MKRLPGILLKLVIITALLIGLSIGVLKLIERKPELLREGIEKYLSETTGLSARIEKTNWIKFYPDLDISLGTITFYTIADPDFFPMEIKILDLKMPFSSVLLGARSFETLRVEGLKAKPDIIFPKAIEVETASVYDDGILPPEIRVRGLYDGEKLEINIGLDRKKNTEEQKLYGIGKETLLSMQIGDISLSGTFSGKRGHAAFRQALLQIGNDVYGPQDLDISAEEDYTPLTSCLFAYGADKALVKENCTGYFDDRNNDAE